MPTIEEIRHRLAKNELFQQAAIDEQLNEWREQSSESAELTAEGFIDYLVDQKNLTEFQGDALLEGHDGPYVIGPYEIQEHVAAGRFGGLFRAVHREFASPVTLKVFPSAFAADAEAKARIGRELRIAVELDHDNVVRSFHLGRLGDICFLTMESLQGETLASRIEHEGQLPYGLACKIAYYSALGLAHLHANGIIHRDIRPANIWLAPGDQPKLLEFGSARDAYAFLDSDQEGAELRPRECVVGEYDYMAPEQGKDVRDADARSDIYSLGCTLYRALTGQVPFAATNPVSTMLKHATETPTPVSEIVSDAPHALDESLAGMMAKDPVNRFQSAEDAAYALMPFLDQDDDADSVEVVHRNQQYMDWMQSQLPVEKVISEDAMGITPELVTFLNSMTRRRRRTKRG